MGNIHKRMPQGVEEQSFTKKKLISYFILTLIFIATSILSIYFISRRFDGETSFTFFNLISLEMWIQLVILLFLYFLFDTLRFMYVLKTLNIHINFMYMLKLAFINIFVSNITPFATGGGLAQIYFLNKKGTPLGNATAAALIRTFLPILFFFITTPFILLLDQNLLGLFPGEHKIVYVVILVLIYGFLTYMSYLTIKKPKILKMVVYKTLTFLSNRRLISKKRVRKIFRFSFLEIDRFIRDLKLFFNGNKRYLWLTMIYTFLFLISLFLFPAVLIRGLGYNFSTFSILKIQTVVTCITYFAITPGATGIAEGGFLLFFKKYVNPSHIAPLTFSWRFFTIYIAMIIGLVLFYLEMFSSRKTK